MDFLWSDNAMPRASHFSVAIYFAFASFAARFFLDRFVFRGSLNETADTRLAIRMLTKGRAPSRINKEMQVKIGKCSESLWKLTYYATVEAFILKVIHHEPWFSNTKLYFKDWPNHELKIGSIILALHDTSDVFMEAAKVFKYSGREFGASECLDLSQGYDTFLYYIFNTLLIMLLIFHIYWWKLICAMISRQLKNRGAVGEDIRSDSDDD
ncbi:LAG1 longevity assurance-like 2 [Mucuna pruriens]|uniref:LAG1 longevity assurance-like 2 n=1 Tax=Mucuna pruriens TaxID=157652 RepID=A0A371GJG6_MUCPR|nr:LAG1 longevity assurance-like 2 [Mucuna pruriens]